MISLSNRLTRGEIDRFPGEREVPIAIVRCRPHIASMPLPWPGAVKLWTSTRTTFAHWFNGPMSPLAGCPVGLFRGHVDGAESGRCEARIEIRKIPGGCLAVDYEAFGADGLQHVEHTLVTDDALYVAHSEAPGVATFTAAGERTFDGPLGGPYAQRLVIGWDGRDLTWVWHWAPTGEVPREQSRAVVRPIDC